jgi:hypothetical protein
VQTETWRLIGCFMGLAGGALFFYAGLFQRAPGAPHMPTFNVRMWKPMWKQRDWFTPLGFKLYWIGYGLFAVGGVMTFGLWPH